MKLLGHGGTRSLRWDGQDVAVTLGSPLQLRSNDFDHKWSADLRRMGSARLLAHSGIKKIYFQLKL
jgi:hypothetical protein